VNFEAAIRRVLAKETPKGKKNAAGYFEYAELVRELCEQFGVPASLHDKALWLLNSEDLDVPAPGPSSRDQPGERMDPQRLADELAMPVATIKRIAGLANERGQVILNGPPGTGKTEVALCIARMIAGNDDRFKKVQFHPSYGYEEFMEGLRPVLKSGALQYEVVPGVFRTLCESARASPQHRHVLVIDEINRGNLPRIFGELLMLLERRGETVTLPDSKQTFSIPKNLTLIGTMNSADRSIALLDLALRRRFPFVQLAPDDTVLRTWLTRKNLPTEVVGIFQTLNRELERAGVEPERSIGHTYFMKERLDEQELEEIWETQIQPLVVELFFDDRSKAAEFDLDKIRARSMTEAAE
jgi:5-methylcytosine-specific restriction protein B